MKTLRKYIAVDKGTQNGQPVFKGTRVPVQTLFWHLEKGLTVEEFLDDFPSVSKEQVVGLLEMMGELVGSDKMDKLDEALA
jgi:uncharacterized protein (DUF433 family)